MKTVTIVMLIGFAMGCTISMDKQDDTCDVKEIARLNVVADSLASLLPILNEMMDKYYYSSLGIGPIWEISSDYQNCTASIRLARLFVLSFLEGAHSSSCEGLNYIHGTLGFQILLLDQDRSDFAATDIKLDSAITLLHETEQYIKENLPEDCSSI